MVRSLMLLCSGRTLFDRLASLYARSLKLYDWLASLYARVARYMIGWLAYMLGSHAI